MANKRQGVVSATDGTVQYVTWWEGAGYSVRIKATDGYTYNYYHLNNDTPGTDDGKGGEMHAFAPDIHPGNPVKAGQLIGWVGDSGNAENTPPHLHFEMIEPNGKVVNPYTSLMNAKKISSPVVYPALPQEILPFGPTTKAGVNVAIGKFTQEGDERIVVGAGKGGGPQIRVFMPDGTRIASFFAYDKNFRGGVDVATGDVDGDGVDEIITGPQAGGGPHVRVFKASGTQIGSFFAYPTTNRDGIRVTTADIDGDGIKEVVTGPSENSGPHIRAFSMTGVIKQSFFAYEDTFRGGVDVAGGDTDNDGVDEIITGPQAGGGPHVRIFQNSSRIASFFVYSKDFRGGVRVSSGKAISGDPIDRVIVTPTGNAKPTVKIFAGNATKLRESTFLEGWWIGHYDVATGDQIKKIAAGLNRRTTIRDAF